MKGILIVLLVLSLNIAYSYSANCNKWEKEENVTCITADGRSGAPWQRTCNSNSCLLKSYANQCVVWQNNTDMCTYLDPNYLSTPCTKWVEAKATCGNSKLWGRSCQIGSEKESVCYDENPTYISTHGGCGEWFRDNGVTCQGKSGSFEQKWSRVCTSLFRDEEVCTNDNPNP